MRLVFPTGTPYVANLKRLEIFGLVLAGLLLSPLFVHAAVIHVSGTLTTSTTWTNGNTYVVDNSYTVNPGATLTVASNTFVKFNVSSSYIDIFGNFNVNGTKGKPVYFTSIDDASVGANIGSSTTPLAGDWGTIRFDAGSTSTITWAVLRYAGGSSAPFAGASPLYMVGGKLTLNNSKSASSTQYGIYIGCGPGCGGTISITSSTFSNNPNYGIFESGYSGSLTLTTSSLANNGTAAAYIGLNSGVNFIPSGNTATGTTAGFVMYGAATSTTWYKDLPYLVDSVSVNPGYTLTINHGAVVKFINTKAFDIQGALSVNGTTADPVYFTSNNDPTGGDTNGTSTTAAAVGDWNKIQIDAGASTTIANAIVRYGGGNSGTTNIYHTGGTLNISGSTISSSTAYGIYTIGGNLNITSSTFNNNSSYGVYESGSGGTLSISSNTFSNSGGAAGYINLSGGVNFSPVNNLATGTGYRGFVIEGTLSTSTTWLENYRPPSPAVGIRTAYIILGGHSVTVASGTTLQINPNVVKFGPGGYLDVAANGSLNIQGTWGVIADPIVFTAFDDDYWRGDTNADGAPSTPVSGDGGYLEIESGANATIKGLYSYYGPGSAAPNSNLYQIGGSLTLIGSTVASSSYYGVQLTGGTCTASSSQFLNNAYGIEVNGGGTLSIASSDFEGNTYYGLYNISGPTSTATTNYWNADSGPYNPSSNPGGTGDKVSGYATFSPWTTSSSMEHYLMGFSSVQNSSTLLWYNSSTKYLSDWTAGVATWSALRSLTITSTAQTASATLVVADVNNADLAWPGEWCPAAHYDLCGAVSSSSIDTVWLNEYYLDTVATSSRQNTTTHELGHALGLAHSYSTNVMFFGQTSQTVLGNQDASDYKYLWH